MAYKKTLVAILLSVGFFCAVSSAQAAQKPVITEPESRAVVDLDTPPQLEWTKVPGATKYDVQIRCPDCGYKFNTPGLRKTKITGGWRFTVTKNEMDLPDGLHDDLYRFRVRARFADGTYSPYTSYRFFKIENQFDEENPDIGEGSDVGDEGLGDAPVISSPKNDKVLKNYPREATLHWSSVSGAKKYEIQLACDVCVSIEKKWQSPWTEYSTKNSLKRTFGSDNHFRYRVRAVYNDNTVGEWSRYAYFSYDTSGVWLEQLRTNPITAWTSQTPAWYNEDIIFHARVGEAQGNKTIKIFIDGRVAETCENTNYCGYTKTMTQKVTYQAKSYDENGRQTAASEPTVLYVTERPGTVIPKLTVRSSDNSVPSASSVTFTSETDNGTSLDRIEIFVNGVNQKTCYNASRCTHTMNMLAYANYTSVAFYAKGYIEATERTIYSSTDAVKIEKSDPVVSIYGPEGSFMIGERLTFEGRVDSAVDRMEFYINGRLEYTCTGPMFACWYYKTLTGADIGTMTYYVKSYVNQTGAVSTSVSKSFTVLSLAPSIYNPTSNATFSGYPAEIYMSWSSITGATHYKLEIECRGCNGVTSWRSVSTQYPSAANYTFTPDRGAANYRFKVLPIYSNTGGTWSDYRYFNYNY